MTTDNTAQTTRANTALIRYPRFNELHEDIRLCQEMSRIAGEPSCMALEGVTGAGKSRLVRAYANAFSRHEAEDGTRIPVFYVQTPSPVTVKGMAVRMLEELGDPMAHRGTQPMMNSRLVHFLCSCGVQLVILDDFHHLIDTETNRILAQVSNWLKVLIKETGIPYLVVGIENSVETILKANSQLSRLFAVRERLQPFCWESEADVQTFALFIKYAEQAVGIALPDTMPRVELLARLFYATDGVIGNIMNLLGFAALLAGQQDLTLATLEQAFHKRLQRHVVKELNPFTTSLVTLEQEPPFVRLDGAGNYSRRRKKRLPSAGRVLSRKP